MAIETDIKFPEPTMDTWRVAAEKALKGADFDSVLRSKTADTLPIEPLYERRPQSAPLARPNGAAPWTLVQKIDHIDPLAANAQAREDLMNGATGLAMVFADSHTARGFGLSAEAQTFDVALEDIDLNAIHLRLEPGPRGKKTQTLFADYVKRAGYEPSRLNVRFGLDAIGAVAACGTMRWPFDVIQQHMRDEWQHRLDDGFKGPFFEADGRPFHDAGATEAQELAIVLANGLAFLRTLEAVGGNARAAADAIGFTLSVDCDQFVNIAKFRAMRLLWNRVQEASGLTPTPTALHAETSWRMMTAGDPNTNMLRITTATFAAGIGGADSVTVSPFTGPLGLPNDFARRMARNVQSILMEESNLYRVTDPAAGSGAFENLSDTLALDAWAKFQEIEKMGGIDKALMGGLIHGWINAANAARKAALQSGEMPILGISLHGHDGRDDISVLDVPRRDDLIITKGAHTIDKLPPIRDEELLGATS
ncbi:MAG: methylmalonyl-CoA mutase family protein [Hyphomicrobiales bacterium]